MNIYRVNKDGGEKGVLTSLLSIDIHKSKISALLIPAEGVKCEYCAFSIDRFMDMLNA